MSNPAFEREMNEALAQPPSIGMNTIFQDAITVLWKHKICYKLESVDPCLFFVHPKNRGTLGLSWHNAHRNGLRIRNVGADKTELKNAYAFEMALAGTIERQKQIDFNQRLIRLSQGLLADASGLERYITLGCGHTAAFCKAAKGNCRTVELSWLTSQGKSIYNVYSRTQFTKP